MSLPSRFYDPALAGIVGRPIDVCYEVTPAGNRTSGGACAASTSNGTILGITFDDPRSVFDGTDRVVDINSNFVSNASGPEVWFTDPFGKHGQTQSFPGSIRQFIARINNDRGGLELAGPHAPN